MASLDGHAPDHTPARGSGRDTDHDHGPENGHGHDHGPENGHGQGHDHGPDNDRGQGHDHGPDNGHEHGPDNGHDHGHDHGPDHGHDHGHDHGSQTWWARLRHGVGDLFGTHSHDVADQIDDTLEANAAGRRALWLSLAALAVTALAQAVVVVLTGSVALLGDTLHNVADALTAVPLLVAFALARRAATRRFTYGFGRAEDLAGLFVIVMIAVSALFAGYEAFRRLLDPQPVQNLWLVAVAGLIGFAGNELVARYRIRVGRQIGSAALVADGLHARTDGFTSLAVVLGAGGMALGWNLSDPIVGLLITVAILGVLRGAVVQVGARLMDAVDPALVDKAIEVIGAVPGVRAVEELRMRWIGHTLRADADVTVDADLTLRQAHDLAHAAEAALRQQIGRLDSVTVHTSPAGAHS